MSDSSSPNKMLKTTLSKKSNMKLHTGKLVVQNASKNLKKWIKFTIRNRWKRFREMAKSYDQIWWIWNCAMASQKTKILFSIPTTIRAKENIIEILHFDLSQIKEEHQAVLWETNFERTFQDRIKTSLDWRWILFKTDVIQLFIIERKNFKIKNLALEKLSCITL